MKILIGVPYYGHIEPEAEQSLRALASAGHTIVRMSSCNIPRARNDLAQQARSNGYDYILYHDSDVIITPDDVDRLVALDKPVVTGLCPMIQKGVIRWAIGLRKQGELYSYLTGSIAGPLPVAACGAACLLVKNEVFKGLEWPWFDFQLSPGQNILGEDFAFTEKCNSNGFEVWLEPRVVISHYKKINITGLVYHAEKNNVCRPDA